MDWLPFFLNPTTPKEGYDLGEYIEKKYGPSMREKFLSGASPLEAAGSKCGISFDNKRRIVNTMDGHRLVEWCKATDAARADKLMELLFHQYFEKAVDLSDRAVLLGCARESGLDAAAAERMLDSADTYTQDVRQQAAKWSGQIDGVPFFILERPGQRPVGLGGAQPVEVMKELLEEAAKAA